MYKDENAQNRTWNQFWIEYGFVEPQFIECFSIELGIPISETDAFYELKKGTNPD